ncbi:MAG: ATP-binding protein [Bacteroides sp.]|nr:ATP-binding protein [Bacteroides sp.]
MKEITIISGKGGTGKTSLTAALASAGSNMVLCDCDVDAADLHLILNPDIRETHTFEGAWSATINPEKCTDCGICTEYCKFEAISLNKENRHQIDPFQCEGCRLCERICPTSAITSTRSMNNFWFVSETRRGPMVHAEMGPGEENSGKLVSQVRKTGRELAKKLHLKYILTDGPPGTGCATIASVTGADAVLVIIEPSISSLHDAERVIELVQNFNIPIFALINKASVNKEMAGKIAGFLKTKEIPHLGEIPFDKSFVEAMIKGLSINEYQPDSSISNTIRYAWSQLTKPNGEES